MQVTSFVGKIDYQQSQRVFRQRPSRERKKTSWWNCRIDVSTPRGALGLRRTKRRVPTFCALPSRTYCQTKDNVCTERRESKTAQSKTTFLLNCKFLLEQEGCKTQQKLKLVQNGHVLRGGEGKEFMRSTLNKQISHNLPWYSIIEYPTISITHMGMLQKRAKA